MKDTVEVTIHAPQAKVAALFDDLRTFPYWMEEIVRTEPVSGDPTGLGAKVRLVPRPGDRGFIVKKVARDLPHWSCLLLYDSGVSVTVRGTFFRVSDEMTKLVSEEIFAFRGFMAKLMGFFGRRAIRNAHRKHMESFKRFAEQS